MTSTKPIITFSWLLRSYKRPRFKLEWQLGFVFACLLSSCSARNNPPRFLIDGQTEIILRQKEGPDTPVGKDIWNLILPRLTRHVVQNGIITFLKKLETSLRKKSITLRFSYIIYIFKQGRRK